MEKETILEELIHTCAQLGYAIRYEKGDFNGGQCILREKRLLIVNKKFPVEKKISTIALALGELGIDAIFVKPVLRNIIENELDKRT